MGDRRWRLVSDMTVRYKFLLILTGQSQFGVCFDRGYNSSKHIRRDDVDLIQQYETPLAGRQEVHHLLRFVGPIRSVGYHGVC